MRLDINLASQPYEDARQFWMRWGTAVGALGLLTLILLALDISGWFAARRDRMTMSQQRTLIADRDKTRHEAETTLNLPENRATRDESQFLNQLIVRKAFSWTRVLENLEKVMPPRVHVVAISPQLDEDNDLLLKMTVAGDSRDRAIELAHRMEESRRFANVNIPQATSIQSQTGDTEQVELVATYIPEAASEAAPAAASHAATDAKPKTPKTPTNKVPGNKVPARQAPANRGNRH
jgi:type IV pilus assembly protein PilN